MNHAPVSLDVFSDFVCPFCYLEEPELDALNARFSDQLTIRWRAFELRPTPAPTLDPDGDYLHDIWGRAVYPMARERGMTLRLPRIQPRSRLAHEATAWAEARSREAGAALRHALFRGFFEDSLDLADNEALCHTAVTLGLSLDVEDLRQALAEGRYTQQVLDDQQIAGELGIQGVPGLRFALNGEHAGILEGAQPRRQLLLAVERLLDLAQQH
ncbi:Predicted dithiol-disulfide isomerase, DsbA family [Franzmannia pantelleriensis]|uniref:Predicted dithiol-disulfide isomerase, DsbA family n=1 Tax=Franzmannia pantelleriensis TaxID=48727 RepID=A0A1G9V910_9GAMM|nr:DsbA family protein [Halomonas pantelleriensis]SDM68692.1 Predicted dithiol-disulfide isomerase, DsbA family [Halomonas pantelleriensis]